MLFGYLRMAAALSRLLEPLRSEVVGLRTEMRFLQQQVQSMSTAFDNLKAAVAAQTSVDSSALILIQGIATQLKQPDADAQALADQLTAATQPLAAAVAANTPAASVANAAGVTTSAPAASTTTTNTSAASTTAAPAATPAAAPVTSTTTTPASPAGTGTSGTGTGA